MRRPLEGVAGGGEGGGVGAVMAEAVRIVEARVRVVEATVVEALAVEAGVRVVEAVVAEARVRMWWRRGWAEAGAVMAEVRVARARVKARWRWRRRRWRWRR
jgi:hypothetical protein